MGQTEQSVQIVGWRERVTIPRFQIGPLKAKLDTGARTSALHATDIRLVEQEDRSYIQFRIYDDHQATDSGRLVQADLVDTRFVRSSVGIRTKRYVIREEISLGDHLLPVQITLVDRVRMRYPLLIGREALSEFGFVVDSTRSWCLDGRRANHDNQ